MSDGDVKKFIIKKTADAYLVWNPTHTYKKMLDDTYFYTIPIMQIIFTSRPYAIITEVESVELTGINLTAGKFTIDYHFLDVDEYVELTNITIEGVFRQSVHEYSCNEEAELTDISLTAGKFQQTEVYDWPIEEVELTSISLTEGKFNEEIQYSNYVREEVELTSISLLEGSHETS